MIYLSTQSISCLSFGLVALVDINLINFVNGICRYITDALINDFLLTIFLVSNQNAKMHFVTILKLLLFFLLKPQPIIQYIQVDKIKVCEFEKENCNYHFTEVVKLLSSVDYILTLKEQYLKWNIYLQ